MEVNGLLQLLHSTLSASTDERTMAEKKLQEVCATPCTPVPLYPCQDKI